MLLMPLCEPKMTTVAMFVFGLVLIPILYEAAISALEWYCWYRHQRAERKGHKTQVELKRGETASLSNRVLFAGPRASIEELLHLSLAHFPGYCMHFLKTIFRIVCFILTYLKTYWITKEWTFRNTTISDNSIYRFITETSLILMASVDDAGEHVSLKLPDDFTIKTLGGFCPAGLHVVMHIESRTIVEATLPGYRGTMLDKGIVFASLNLAFSLWIHTQSHVAAEKCAREIASKPTSLASLRESSYHVVALHEALLYLWPTSPVSFFNKGLLFFTGCDGPSFYAYTQAVKIPHNLDPSKLKLFPYFRYMYEGRRAVHRLDLDVDAELLFNNIVVHSADHYNLYQLGKDVLYPFDGTFTFASYLKSVTFQHYWTPPVNSLFRDERLRCSDVPFYKALYEELSSIDKELADNTSKSCSY